jgi:hypothetical protein
MNDPKVEQLTRLRNELQPKYGDDWSAHLTLLQQKYCVVATDLGADI